jgi:hypothetical protein
MRVVCAVALALVLAPAASEAQQTPPPAAPAKVPPGEPASKPTVASSARTFTTPAGIIVNAVRPERVADFEKVLGYLQAAMSASANATVRAQAEGWRFYKASEPGPNGSVVYIFLLDPAVTGVEYGLGRILAAEACSASRQCNPRRRLNRSPDAAIRNSDSLRRRVAARHPRSANLAAKRPDSRRARARVLSMRSSRPHRC